MPCKGRVEVPWPAFLFLEDFRFEELVVIGGSLEGPAESLYHHQHPYPFNEAPTYPGLDITAGFFPFRWRGGATVAGAGGGRIDSGSAIFWRLGRRADECFADSGSGAGLASRAKALRFLEGAWGRVDEGVAVVPTEAPDDSEELAACLADALVILPDMMVSILLRRKLPNRAEDVVSIMESNSWMGRFKKRWKEVGELGRVPGSCDCLSFAIFAHSLIHRLTPFGGRVSSLSQELLGAVRNESRGEVMSRGGCSSRVYE